MPPAGFEPAIPASVRPQTDALDRSATGIGLSRVRTAMCVLTLTVQDWCHRTQKELITATSTESLEMWVSASQSHCTWRYAVFMSLQGHCSAITVSCWHLATQETCWRFWQMWSLIVLTHHRYCGILLLLLLLLLSSSSSSSPPSLSYRSLQDDNGHVKR